MNATARQLRLQEPERMRVAYVLGNFPVLSQTFVIQEIRDHLEAGLDLSVIVLGCERDSSTSLESVHRELRHKTRYLGVPGQKSALLWSFGKMAVADPRAVANSLNVWRGRRFSDALVAARLFALKPRYDVLHCHFGNIGRTASIMRRNGLLSGKLVVTIHGFDISKGDYGSATDYYADLFENTDCLLPVSNHWKTKLESLGADSNKVLVHRMGVDVERLQPFAPSGRAGTLRLSSVGRFVEKKGHLYSIRALARLKTIRPDLEVSLLLVGDGPLLSQARALAQSLGVKKNVDFRGSLPHAPALNLMADSDAFILPSVTAADGNMEGVPVSLMEAMALQKPVISTWHSGIPELVENDVSGLLVPERDVDALARAIESFADNPAQRVKLGAAGRSKVERSFNARTLGRELRALYASLIKDSRVQRELGESKLEMQPQ